MTANPHCPGSVCEQVQYPVAEYCTQPQSVMLSNQFLGGDED